MSGADFLRGVEPFNRLEADLFERVAGLVRPVHLEKAAWLVQQGVAPDGGLMVIVEGRASIVAESDGEERLIGTCGPGELVGLTGALTDQAHPVGVRADTRVQCLQVPREALDLSLDRPGFAAFFSRTLAQRLRLTYGELVQEHDYRSVGMDTQPFRQRVAEIMQGAPATCGSDQSATQIAALMKDRHISSVVVVAENRPVGIVTSMDLVAKVLATGLDPSVPVGDLMSTELETIVEGSFYYEALLRMVRRGIKHLPVTDPSGLLVGMVTLGDLARARGKGALSVVDLIEREESLPGLAVAARQVDDVLRALMAEGGQPWQVLPVITELNDRMTRRIIALAIRDLGEPPGDWCWLQMGSAGREEQFTRSDQDNGLIYSGNREDLGGYFEALARFVVDGLEACGFARCPGDVMATNRAWRKSLREWRFDVISMVTKPIPENIRTATIFLDFRPIAGNRALAADLREQVWVTMESMPPFLYNLVRDDLSHRVPIGPFKTLLTPLWGEHKGQINLKADACVHAVDLLRALAVKHRLTETSTRGRLGALIRLGVIGKDEGEWLDIAYQTLMRIRMHDAIGRLNAGEPLRNHIPLGELTEPERAALKDALVAVARLQETVGSVLAPGGGV